MLIPDLTDIPELAAVEAGEYDLRIIKAKEGKSKRTGRPSIDLLLEVVGEENAENVFHSIWLPMETDSEEKAQVMYRMIKEFLTSLDLPLDGISDVSVFEDIEFTGILSYKTHREDTDEELPKPRNEFVRVT